MNGELGNEQAGTGRLGTGQPGTGQLRNEQPGNGLPSLDFARLVEVLGDLVRIPSVNPGFPSGHGEQGVAGYVKSFFSAMNAGWVSQHVEGTRENVIGTLPGRDGGRYLLLEAHMDTVQVDGMTIPPFEGTVRDGRMYGRGACDTKASLAAMLVAVETLHRQGAVPPLTVRLAAVVDEEIGYRGVSALAERLAGEAPVCEGAIVGEPTGLNLITAHKGCVRFHIDVHGKAAHSSEPGLGVNAIGQAVPLLLALQAIESSDYPLLDHPLTGPPTHCISMIRGGVAPNTVPELCRLTLDRRTVPGEEPMEVYHSLASRLAEELGGQTKITVNKPFIIDYALDNPQESPFIAELLAAAARSVPAARAEGAPYGSDASKLARIGIPSVVFGPGSIAQAHTHDEWVELGEVAQAAQILIDFIMNYK
ncbi:M20 family metallopeptidase [Paenibacillus sp. S150]|uniref:M20 family metallopeptidase n=1 Tax=Paenibacillus sp. S150 TaxID=2749826 RepID=UPI001C58FEDE|nr:M20 family metallopeptidase [Paenibacillus sp. S150]MBW4080156.1 M20 family metallopeptidase [Paenibacillus sp. S150]